jgi:hypothetical protein
MSFIIQVSEKNTDSFSFELDGKVLSDYLARVTSVTGFISGGAAMRRHLLVSYEKQLFLVGYSNDTFVAINTGAKTRSSGACRFDPDLMKGLLKGRKDCKFEFTGAELRFASGRYKGSIKCEVIDIDEINKINGYFSTAVDKKDSLSPELLARLHEGVSRTNMVDYHDEKVANSPITINYDGKALRVMTLTNWSGAMYEAQAKSKHDSFNMVITRDVYNLIKKVAGETEEDLGFYISDEQFRVENDLLSLGLPPLQESEHSIEKFVELMTDLEKAKALGQYQLDVEEAKDTMANIDVLSSDSSAVNMDFQTKKGKGGKPMFRAVFGISNDLGSTENSFQVKFIGPKKPIFVQGYSRIVKDMFNNAKAGKVTVSMFAAHGNKEANIVAMEMAAGKETLKQFACLVA